MDQHILNGQSPAPDFSFAFNNRYFSDRMLQIHILPDENGDGSYMTTECSNKSVRVESLHVSSVILAEKSAFLNKVRRDRLTYNACHVYIYPFTYVYISFVFFLISFYGA